LDGIDEKTGRKRIDLAITRAERNYNHSDHSNPAHAKILKALNVIIR